MDGHGNAATGWLVVVVLQQQEAERSPSHTTLRGVRSYFPGLGQDVFCSMQKSMKARARQTRSKHYMSLLQHNNFLLGILVRKPGISFLRLFSLPHSLTKRRKERKKEGKKEGRKERERDRKKETRKELSSLSLILSSLLFLLLLPLSERNWETSKKAHSLASKQQQQQPPPPPPSLPQQCGEWMVCTGQRGGVLG